MKKTPRKTTPHLLARMNELERLHYKLKRSFELRSKELNDERNKIIDELQGRGLRGFAPIDAQY